MKFKMMVADGEMAPWYMGAARYDLMNQCTECYLIPFNWIVAGARLLLYFLARPKITTILASLEDRRQAYDLGRVHGERDWMRPYTSGDENDA